MADALRILIGTLYAGEHEYDRCVEAIRSQTYTRWEHFTIANLPEREAHERLYRAFMDRAGEFDLFIKIDADMVLRDRDRLSAVVDLFRQRPALAHAVLAVDDWMSQSLIHGLHVYRSTTRWEATGERLFVDRPPRIAGKRAYFRRDPAPLVRHMPDPHPLQAMHFGAHRALKIVQPGREDFHFLASVLQWRLLRRVWFHYQRSDDPRLGLALAGACEVLNGEHDLGHTDYGAASLQLMFDRLRGLSAAGLRSRVEACWGGRWGSLGSVMGLLARSAKQRAPRWRL